MINQYRYKTYDLNLGTDFWNNYPKKYRYSHFYDFLRQLVENFEPDIHGIVLFNWQQAVTLYTGETHPLGVLPENYGNTPDWIYDILDIEQKSFAASSYKQTYGEWFIKIQNQFRINK